MLHRAGLSYVKPGAVRRQGTGPGVGSQQWSGTRHRGRVLTRSIRESRWVWSPIGGSAAGTSRGTSRGIAQGTIRRTAGTKRWRADTEGESALIGEVEASGGVGHHLTAALFLECFCFVVGVTDHPGGL